MEIQVTGLAAVTPGSCLVLWALCDAVHSSRNSSALLQLPALSLTRSISETRLPGSDLTGDSHLPMVRQTVQLSDFQSQDCTFLGSSIFSTQRPVREILASEIGSGLFSQSPRRFVRMQPQAPVGHTGCPPVQRPDVSTVTERDPGYTCLAPHTSLRGMRTIHDPDAFSIYGSTRAAQFQAATISTE